MQALRQLVDMNEMVIAVAITFSCLFAHSENLVQYAMLCHAASYSRRRSTQWWARPDGMTPAPALISMLLES